MAPAWLTPLFDRGGSAGQGQARSPDRGGSQTAGPAPADGASSASDHRRVGDAVVCPPDYDMDEWIAVNGTRLARMR